MIVETENLRKEYRQKVAVKDISIRVEEGQIFGFLGPNGAGKSTLIKMLTGLVHPTSGSGQVLGYPLGHVHARSRMGYLPELFRYQPWMTGEDLLNFHSMLFRMNKSRDRNQKVLRRVGLLGQEKYKVGSYSKGMQQRIGLACALLPDPALLFLDEPTSALDPVGRKEVRDVILSLKNDGATIFLNSHLLSEVEAVSDSITIIHHGEVVKSGAINDLLAEKTMLTVRADGITAELLAKGCAQFALEAVRHDDGSILFANVEHEDIPVIASYFVAQGVKLYALVPQHETLEQFFLNVIGKDGDSPSEPSFPLH